VIINKVALNNGDIDNIIIVATTSLYEDDNLYHVEDMNKLLTYNHKDYNVNYDKTYCNISIEKALRNAQIKYKITTSNLNSLEVLHVKLGHTPEYVTKRILKFNML
jgi:hypothetical protein